MTIGERIEERRIALGISSQSELARRAGVGQSTLNGLIRNPYRWSPYLTKIARELSTTVEYLTGETDNPDADGSQQPSLSHSDRDLLQRLERLPTATRGAITAIVKAFGTDRQTAGHPPLPDEDALTAMFEALLSGIDRKLEQAEQARLLAQRLPIGLSHLRELRPGPGSAAPAAADEAPAMRDRAPTR